MIQVFSFLHHTLDFIASCLLCPHRCRWQSKRLEFWPGVCTTPRRVPGDYVAVSNNVSCLSSLHDFANRLYPWVRCTMSTPIHWYILNCWGWKSSPQHCLHHMPRNQTPHTRKRGHKIVCMDVKAVAKHDNWNKCSFFISPSGHLGFGGSHVTHKARFTLEWWILVVPWLAVCVWDSGTVCGQFETNLLAPPSRVQCVHVIQIYHSGSEWKLSIVIDVHW